MVRGRGVLITPGDEDPNFACGESAEDLTNASSLGPHVNPMKLSSALPLPLTLLLIPPGPGVENPCSATTPEAGEERNKAENANGCE